MYIPIKFYDTIDINSMTNRGTLTMVHTADLHFGCMDAKVEYDILKEQLVYKLEPLHFDIFSINGDLFDRKYMSNTDAIKYATLLIADIVALCKRKNATLLLLAGTKEHDAGQLVLFYHYMKDPDIDIRIVETIQFEYIKGSKVLCIPELYGIDESIYQYYLEESGPYDMCFMHGTMKGAIYKDNVGQSRLFTIEDFINCRGLIVSGHVHTGGCFNTYFYYTGSPLRWKYGEEETKGFLLILYNLDTREHYTHLEEVKSFRYDTINLDELITSDPKDIIHYVDQLHSEGIDNIRIEFSKDIPTDNLNILRNYYRTNGHIKFKIGTNKSKVQKDELTESDLKIYEEFAFLFDNSMNAYDKTAMFIMKKEPDVYITGDEIKRIVMNDDF
ncbi:MAG: hypothetical protein PHC62_01025 [Candidatus Izemoplasmatales bacterium]|nr:hypothetical protein [Candidatus Izemoplasmatales bacterium]